MDNVLVRLFATQWQIVLIVSAFFMILAEAGYRLGRRLHLAKDEPRRGQIGGVQAAVLGMSALLLGFTFSMAAGRYETRRLLLMQEAGAIEAAHLRAAFLPEGKRDAVRGLLRRYVEEKIAFHEAGIDIPKVIAAHERGAALQKEMWAYAVEEGRGKPTPLTAAFVSSVIGVIDADSSRLNALLAHVPGTIWLILLLVSGTGCFAIGYGAGASGARNAFSSALLPLLITVVIALISDLDRSRRGLITESQRPLEDLRKSFREPAP